MGDKIFCHQGPLDLYSVIDSLRSSDAISCHRCLTWITADSSSSWTYFSEIEDKYCLLNSSLPGQNGRHFADDIFKCIFLNEDISTSIKFSLNFVPKGSIHNIPALVQIMAWRRPGDKPLSEPIMVSLLTHICVTRPQCIWTVWTLSVILFKPHCAALDKTLTRENRFHGCFLEAIHHHITTFL